MFYGMESGYANVHCCQVVIYACALWYNAHLYMICKQNRKPRNSNFWGVPMLFFCVISSEKVKSPSICICISHSHGSCYRTPLRIWLPSMILMMMVLVLWASDFALNATTCCILKKIKRTKCFCMPVGIVIISNWQTATVFMWTKLCTKLMNSHILCLMWPLIQPYLEQKNIHALSATTEKQYSSKHRHGEQKKKWGSIMCAPINYVCIGGQNRLG